MTRERNSFLIIVVCLVSFSLCMHFFYIIYCINEFLGLREIGIPCETVKMILRRIGVEFMVLRRIGMPWR
ncbi:hypothetical protein Scep_006800 [Stephania cephalantha]|uniref:Uncharacterized protein n=1 Tax=Stephania cephalantha TaxID=152367 RepID=A0AAP0PKF6_9MAGN